MRGRTTRTLTTRITGDDRRRGPDELIVEEPLAIHLDDHMVATTMRTPGHDFELAAGFCFSEGLLGGATVQECRYCGTGSAVDTEFNVVSVNTGGRAPVPTPRLATVSSSCGLCGSATLDELRDRLHPIVAADPFAVETLRSGAEAAQREQALFAVTGAVHAAAAVDRTGTPVVVREDIGRHNAVDKVVGHLLLAGDLPAGDRALYVSGRASFEIVQKAWAAGFPAVVAVSAPSALAVETARVAGIQLAGFLRDDSLNLYTEDPPSAAK